MSDFTPAPTGNGVRARIQRGGAFLSGMVMPNLGAFIAFGLITALFIPTGWINTIAGRTEDPLPITIQIASVVGPLIVILIPILIGYTGGKMIHGTRGAVVGAVATIGAMLAPVALQLAAPGLNGAEAAAPPANISEVGPAILAALILGPVAALALKAWDRFIDGKVKGGFEMLIDNFSAGIIGGVFAIIGIYIVGPLTFWISAGLGQAVNGLVEARLLPLVSIIIEPAKVLFLNNALNHGVLTPLGAGQLAETGKSIMFMLESNPGPGLGILTAMLLFGPRAIRPTVPAAMVVHFLGGIHEIYFPYVLMKPILVIAAILGGATGVLWEVIFNLGLVGPASPGSIFAWILVSPPDNLLLNMVAIVLSAAVAAIVGSVLLGFGRNENVALDLDEARARSANHKLKKPAQADA
ncbi:MAG: PTS mannitol transporter subunit IICB [Salinibacterium sp.]|nr:PTS mannitol transporter subunit IICB [Salinibacterium sp.]